MTSISFDAIHKHFPTKRHRHEVLRGLSFSAQSGDIVGLVGPNGSGKTTTLHILMGHERPDAGSLFINGADVMVLPFEQQKKILRRYGCLLPENPNLPKYQSGHNLVVEYGVLDGLTLPQAEQKANNIEALLPVKHFWTKPCLYYSKGQAGLISLARVMILERELVLLDEPTIGLDFDATQKIHAWIKSLSSQGKIVVVSTHLINDLQQLTSNIVGIDQGQQATPNTIKKWLYMPS